MFIQSHHQISVTGRVTREPQVNLTNEGIEIISFSIPTNWVSTNEDLDQTETIWFDVTLRGQRANAAGRVLQKNDFIQVVGRLKPALKTKELKDGRRVEVFEIIAEQVIFLPLNGKQ